MEITVVDYLVLKCYELLLSVVMVLPQYYPAFDHRKYYSAAPPFKKISAKRSQKTEHNKNDKQIFAVKSLLSMNKNKIIIKLYRGHRRFFRQTSS